MSHVLLRVPRFPGMGTTSSFRGIRPAPVVAFHDIAARLSVSHKVDAVELVMSMFNFYYVCATPCKEDDKTLNKERRGLDI